MDGRVNGRSQFSLQLHLLMCKSENETKVYGRNDLLFLVEVQHVELTWSSNQKGGFMSHTHTHTHTQKTYACSVSPHSLIAVITVNH